MEPGLAHNVLNSFRALLLHHEVFDFLLKIPILSLRVRITRADQKTWKTDFGSNLLLATLQSSLWRRSLKLTEESVISYIYQGRDGRYGT